jgi:hypothetical protein
MDSSIKLQLHQLIDDCNDYFLLEEAKALLEITSTDWWNELTDADRILLQQSESDYEKGHYISHQQLMLQLAEWKKK